MKKLVLFALLFVPVVSVAAPSVRMLGTGAGVAAIANSGGTSGTKITPVRAATAGNANVPARLGTLRAKSIGGGAVSGGTGTTSSRFPVITAAKVYNNVNVPSGQPSQAPTVVQGDVNVEEIVNAVTQRVESNYYNKNTIDTKLEEINGNITNINNNLDDSRFDAIRTVNPRDARGVDAPEGYVYIWVEE